MKMQQRLLAVTTVMLFATNPAWATDDNSNSNNHNRRNKNNFHAEKFPATGQTKCYGTIGYITGVYISDIIDCVGSGQDGEVQAGGLLHYTNNGDTITDDNTKLEWEKKVNWNGSEDPSNIHDADNAYTWSDAFDVFIKDLNTEPCFARHCDWRLPNVKELQSIVDYGQHRPAIHRIFIPSDLTGLIPNRYWWSSTSVNDMILNTAWTVSFHYGSVQESFKNNKGLVRAVRGGLTH